MRLSQSRNPAAAVSREGQCAGGSNASLHSRRRWEDEVRAGSRAPRLDGCAQKTSGMCMEDQGGTDLGETGAGKDKKADRASVRKKKRGQKDDQKTRLSFLSHSRDAKIRCHIRSGHTILIKLITYRKLLSNG